MPTSSPAGARNFQKRGGQLDGGRLLHVELEEAASVIADAERQSAELVALDDALQALEKIDPRKCRVVELRYFGGLSIPETAEALGISEPTVTRDWATARAWLRRAMSREENDDA